MVGVHGGSRGGLSIGLIGTYPPTKCGIATFTASLARAMASAEPDARFGVVAAVTDDSSIPYSSEVIARLVGGSADSRAAAVAALEEFDVIVLQHEFGIYGGEDGSEVLDLVRALAVPVIAVLHTVPRRPTPGQRAILEELAVLADRVVVQTAAARARLLEQYDVQPQTVVTIPHGARANLFGARRHHDRIHPPVVLTWGLLSRDKGIEWGVEAIALLSDLDPAPRYVVVGQTHPRVLEAQGEEYRHSLVALAAELAVRDRVEFDDAYHDTHSLLARVREADVVLLPYRSREQVVSGVLVEAIASGKPVVSTRFPHAEELLGEGSGILVPHEDADAIAAALRHLLTDPALAFRAATVARRQARSMFWDNVGERYLALVREIGRAGGLTFPSPPFEHLLRLSDDVGVFEHAKLTEPRREHGYCTDDVARALVAVLHEQARTPQLERLEETCIAFLERAQRSDGRFHNRLSVERRWLDEVGSDDATGRALWAAGTAAATATTRDQRERAVVLFAAATRFSTRSPRANAFAVLGAVELLPGAPARVAEGARRLIERAAEGLGAGSLDPDWPWPEPRLAYANAVLAEARIAAGAALRDDPLVAEGLDLLAWLVETETNGDHFSFTPVGGWEPGELRPGFDQQPIEAAAMADACARAFDITARHEWALRALRAAAWFLGANDLGEPLLDRAGGGCYDGLTAAGVNTNEGAESTIALITALQQAGRLQAAVRSASMISAVSTAAAPTHRSAAPYVR